jgi:hypothetical protein
MVLSYVLSLFIDNEKLFQRVQDRFIVLAHRRRDAIEAGRTGRSRRSIKRRMTYMEIRRWPIIDSIGVRGAFDREQYD